MTLRPVGKSKAHPGKSSPSPRCPFVPLLCLIFVSLDSWLRFPFFHIAFDSHDLSNFLLPFLSVGGHSLGALSMPGLLVSFPLLRQNPEKVHLQGGGVLFGSQCWSLQPMFSWFCCFGPWGKADHHGGELAAEHSCSPQGSWEAKEE